MVWGLGLRVWGLGFGVSGFGFRIFLILSYQQEYSSE